MYMFGGGFLFRVEEVGLLGMIIELDSEGLTESILPILHINQNAFGSELTRLLAL